MRRHEIVQTAPQHLVSRMSKVNFPEKVQSSNMPYTVVHVKSRSGSGYTAPDTVVLPQLVLNQVSPYKSHCSVGDELGNRFVSTVRSESQHLVDALRVLGQYDQRTSTLVHPKPTQANLVALRRDEFSALPRIPCERRKSQILEESSSIEAEMGSPLPPGPEIAARIAACCPIQQRILEELRNRLMKKCMLLRCFDVHSFLFLC